MADIPRYAEEFTAGWLNEALAAGGYLGEHRVVRATARDSETPGQTAEIACIEVEYAREECPLPRRFIAKYASRNHDLVTQIIGVFQHYWRETSFYNELSDPGIPVPACFYADHDPTDQSFVILMEDLAPAISPSWASTPEQVAQAISYLPAFHARWWNAGLLREKPWLVQYDNLDFYASGANAALAALPKVDEQFGDTANRTQRVVELWHAKQDRALNHFATRPFTLVHGDYHPKQLFFPSAEGGSFAVIDWQFSFVAAGAWDLIRMMTLGQDCAARRASQEGLIDDYFHGLRDHGVTGYSKAQLLDDLRIGLVINQVIMTVALADTDVSLIERECTALGLDWRDVLLLRGEDAVQDFGVVEFMEGL